MAGKLCNTPRPAGSFGGDTVSVSVMTRVWASSRASKGQLLVLLAIADFADDDGRAWPSVCTLAKKARLSERETQYVLRQLEEMGELRVLHNEGPKGCNLYQIQEGVQLLQGCNPCTGAISNRGGAISRIKGVQPTAPEPSL